MAGTKIPQSVLVVIHAPDGSVLLLERTDRPGFWQSVTGSKDAVDEPWELTGRREVREETGFDVDALVAQGARFEDWGIENRYEIYGHWRHRYPEGVTHNVERVFGLRLPAAMTPVLSPREHLGFAWLPWAEAAERCFSPSNAEAIRRLPLRAAGAASSGP